MMRPVPMLIPRFFAAAALTFALGLPVAAWAADTATTAAAAADVPKPPPGFERVAGGADTEKVDANKLVVIAYATFFGGMFGYLIYVARKQAEMAKEMAELAARIDKVKKS